MCSLLKTIAIQSYSSMRAIVCIRCSESMLQNNNRLPYWSTAAAATITTTAIASKQQRKRVERDNNTIRINQGHQTKHYQSHSRLTFTTSTTTNTATATVDRPVYLLTSFFGSDLVSGKHLPSHNRFYCTKTSKKKSKMASIRKD